MKKLISSVAIVVLSVVLITPAHAQMKKVGQTGFQFLKADMSARSAGMGGAFVMVADDASAMFHNPAGLAYVSSGVDAFGTMTQWIADINYSAAGVAIGLGNIGTIGFNFMTVDYGDIIGTRLPYYTTDSQEIVDRGFVETGMLDVGAIAAGAGYARRLTNKFIVGGQIRYAYQNLDESRFANLNVDIEGTFDEDSTFTEKNEVSGLTYEFGTIFYPGIWPSLKVGMSIKNFSQQFEYAEEPFQLPLLFTLGFAVDLFEVTGMDGGNSLLLAVDALHPRDFTERIHIGTEFGFMDFAYVRAGYKFNYDIESLSLGGGLNLSLGGIGLKIDAAYSLMEYFDDVMRFTVGFSL
ncbi:PorV/PorQ family protein [Candidatus Neomarinimicrobiota bacterium]